MSTILNLANQYISASFQPLMQISSSGAIYDGFGIQITNLLIPSITGSLFGTASYALNASSTGSSGATPTGPQYSVQLKTAGSTLIGTASFLYDYDNNILTNGYRVNSTVAQGGIYSHGEGSLTVTAGAYSHAEGATTIASGAASHAEGLQTVALGSYSHAEGSNTLASGFASKASGLLTTASGDYSSAEGYQSYAQGTYSHAEGGGFTFTVASGQASHAEGLGTRSKGAYSHAEGYISTAEDFGSHAEGNAYVSGSYSHGEGLSTHTYGVASHGEGWNTNTIADGAHAEGNSTYAAGLGSHTEGYYTKTTAIGSHAQGYFTTASGNYSFTGGTNTVASASNQTVFGCWNIISTSSNDSFIIGSGNPAFRTNAFRVNKTGNCYSGVAFVPGGADYAEYFQSYDGVAIPPGTIVELTGSYIKQATTSSNAIGVISSRPGIIGNSDEDAGNAWVNKYLKNEFGQYILEAYSYEEQIGINSLTGDPIKIVINDTRRVINPEWNASMPYIARENRLEWNVVGLLGQVRILNSESGSVPPTWRYMQAVTGSSTLSIYLIK